MNAIDINNLTKYYGKHRGIEDVTLSVEQGEFFGFIGPNGSGKSTTIRLLLGLIRPTSGTAHVLGRPLRKHDDYLNDVGYLPSETLFYRGMRVRDTIRLSADLRGRNCKHEAVRLCDALALDTTKRVEELSLGNRKKLAIVCALQHKPKLYILDEPTSGLDPLVQRDFFALLKERSARGATVFFSSHVLSEVQRHCTRTGVIRDGRLVAQGGIEQLVHSSAKRVTIHGVNALPTGIPAQHVRELHAEKNAVEFVYTGDASALAAALAHTPCTDFTVVEPDLEETFMHYYEGDERP